MPSLCCDDRLVLPYSKWRCSALYNLTHNIAKCAGGKERRERGWGRAYSLREGTSRWEAKGKWDEERERGPERGEREKSAKWITLMKYHDSLTVRVSSSSRLSPDAAVSPRQERCRCGGRRARGLSWRKFWADLERWPGVRRCLKWIIGRG